MTLRNKTLLWAALIIAAALISVGMGLNTGASMGIVGGLSGAALGSLQSDGACGSAFIRGCLQ